MGKDRAIKFIALLFIGPFFIGCSPYLDYSVLSILAPSLSWNTTNYDFGDSIVGSSPTATFTLVNASQSAATGCGAIMLSDNINFNITSNQCNQSTMAPGESCQIEISPVTSSPGNYSLQISRMCVSDVEIEIPQVSVSINILPSNPVLSWSPLTHSFGNVSVGASSSDFVFTFENAGGVDATSCGSPNLTNSTDFSIVSDLCSNNDLVSLGHCDVSVRANPQSSGSKATTLSRTCGVGGTATTTSNQIIVTGTGGAPPSLAADWQQEFYFSDLGLVTSSGGSSNEFTYYFRNPNSSALTGCTAPSLMIGTDFSIQTDGCGAGTMDSASLCVVKVVANPMSVGTVSDTLIRTCNETGQSDIALSAVGGASGIHTTKIFAGSSFSCALQSNGTVKCWGYDSNGALGDGVGTTMTYLPVEVTGLSDVIDMSVMNQTACALLSTGSVKCWGKNDVGQLGDGGTTDQYSPVLVSGISNAIKISTGGYWSTGSNHTCAVLSNNTLKCWGKNDVGQLGDGGTTDSSVPVVATGITNVIDVATSGQSTCVLKNDNSVQCWGKNDLGQLGDGTTTDSLTPVVVTGGVANAIKLTAGTDHFCALLSDQTAKCWGYGGFRQTGPSGGMATSTPVDLGLVGISSLSTGTFHTCATLTNNETYCIGQNRNGQVGDGNRGEIVYTQSLVAGLSSTQVAAGESHSCALLTDQTVKCWGANGDAYLGHGGGQTMSYAQSVPGISTATQVVSGDYHTCVLLSDQTIWCWGMGEYGQLGNAYSDSNYATSTPQQVVGINTATQVTGAGYGTCALLADNTVWCWGDQQYGKLGNGSSGWGNQSTPVKVNSITDAIQISGGYDHRCALLNGGGVKCWGRNDGGQLGTGSSNSHSENPVDVINVANAIKISLGRDRACALISGGTIKCWGGGVGATPQAVAGISTAVDVSSGESHSCAVLANGTVRCWGSGSWGELGNGSNSSSATPVAVTGISNAVSVNAGNGFSCALLANQKIKCWGYNGSGSLGDGTLVASNVPVYRLSSSNVSSLGLGHGYGYNQCAITSGQVVQCTGMNHFGQAGINLLVPFKVSGL